MISKIDFAAIDTEVKDNIHNTLENIRAARPGDYILFLADGEYKKDLDKPAINFNPYVINSMEERYKDHDRLKFLADFLSLFYSFHPPQTMADDNDQRLHIELMIYTHIWESQPFLKRLYRLAHLSKGEQYKWEVVIPEMGKHKFIIDEVRQTFGDHGNNMSEVIRNGFHTSLRNAFAHSEYFFDRMNSNNRILLENYGGKAWELRSITFDEWSRRFVYSALLSYYLLDITSKHRKALITTFKTDQLQIKLPTKSGSSRMVWLKYHEEHDRFAFQK